MKKLKYVNAILAGVFGVVSLGGFKKGLLCALLFLGFNQFTYAKEFYDQGQRKGTILAVVAGLWVCLCGFMLLTNGI